MKNIYKDEVIGNINSNLIYNNEIKGVFGSVVDISKVPLDNPNQPNVLTSENRGGTGTYTSSGAGISGPSYGIASINIDATFPNRSLVFLYENPIENTQVSIRLHYVKRYATASLASESIRNLYRNTIAGRSGNFQFGAGQELLEWPTILNYDTTNEYSDIDFNITVDRFRVSISITHTILTLFSSFSESNVNSTTGTASISATYLNPTHVEIIISGDTYRITPQAFQYGSTENAFEQPQSTLLTTKATYKGQPLWEHMSNKIVNGIKIGDKKLGGWKDGKQVVSLPTIINNEEDIKEVNEETYIFNVRRGEIDENNQNQVNNASIFKTLDGKAKKYIIVNTTPNYNGSFYQDSDLQEVIE